MKCSPIECSVMALNNKNEIKQKLLQIEKNKQEIKSFRENNGKNC